MAFTQPRIGNTGQVYYLDKYYTTVYSFMQPAEIFHYLTTICKYAAKECTSKVAKDVLWHEVNFALHLWFVYLYLLYNLAPL